MDFSAWLLLLFVSACITASLISYVAYCAVRIGFKKIEAASLIAAFIIGLILIYRALMIVSSL